MIMVVIRLAARADQLASSGSSARARWLVLAEMPRPRSKPSCDIYFVNRRALKHLKKKHMDKINETFAQVPRGCGKLTSVLNQIIADKFRYALERKLLIIVLTDEALLLNKSIGIRYLITSFYLILLVASVYRLFRFQEKRMMFHV
jgi:hypothetical protein